MVSEKESHFFRGIIIGLAGGVFGNIFVTSMYRIIDGNTEGHNVLTFLVGLIFFIIIMAILFYKLDRK